MVIQKEGERSFMVELTAVELQEYALTYRQLNLKDAKTKRLLQALLSNAGRMMGFKKGSGKLLVEVYPAPLQGCVIYFTNVGNLPKRYRKTAPCLLHFHTCEDLLQGVACLGENRPKSEVYRYQEGYILILHSHPISPLLEFADLLPCTGQLLCHIREHGHLLCKPNAVERLQGQP